MKNEFENHLLKIGFTQTVFGNLSTYNPDKVFKKDNKIINIRLSKNLKYYEIFDKKIIKNIVYPNITVTYNNTDYYYPENEKEINDLLNNKGTKIIK